MNAGASLLIHIFNYMMHSIFSSIKIHIILYCKCKHVHIQIIIIIIIIIIILILILIIIIINMGNDITVSWDIYDIYHKL